MTAKRILIIIGILVLICCVGGGVALFLAGRAVVGVANQIIQPMTDATEGFMTNLKNGDYATAYDQLTPDAQTAFGGTADSIKTALSGQGLAEPASWKFTSPIDQGTPQASGNSLIEFLGTATYKYGR